MPATAVKLPWTAFFPAAILAKGQAYHHERRVQQLLIDGDRLAGTVQGTQRYQVTVELRGAVREPGALRVDLVLSACSCPVGHLCKHAAALLVEYCQRQGLQVRPGASSQVVAPPARIEPPAADVLPEKILDGRGQALPREVGRWLDWLRAEAPAAAPAGGERLAWILTQEPSQRHVNLEAVQIVPRRTKPWGVAKRYTVLYGLIQAAPAWLTSSDLRLLHQVDAQLRSLDDDQDAPPPGFGVLIDRMVDSGRTWWNEVEGQPLRAGPPIQARFLWEAVGDRHRLVLHSDQAAGFTVLPVDPLRYRCGSEVGPLDVSGSPGQVLGLLRMPPLDAVGQSAAAPALARVLPELPPPLARPTERPEPNLVSAQVQAIDERDWRWPRPSASATVVVPWFRYQVDGREHHVGPGGAAVLKLPEGGVLVRDQIAESEAMSQLRNLGLVHVGEVPHLVFRTEGRTSELGFWLYRASLPGRDHGGRIAPITLPPAILENLHAWHWRVDGRGGAPPPVVLDAGDWYADVREAGPGGETDGERHDWFQLHLGVRVDDELVPVLPALAKLLVHGRDAIAGLPRAEGSAEHVLLPLGDGRLLRVRLDQLLLLHDHLIELFDAPPSASGGLRLDTGQAALVLELDQLSPRWLGDAKLRKLAETLRQCAAPPPLPPPAGLRAELRPYQLAGYAWLQHLRGLGLGALLADDMGLGKTVQTIAYLLAEREAGRADRPSLVVCPASVTGTWQRELARFAPELLVLVLHGLNRERDPAALARAAVLVTSYGTLLRDAEMLGAIPLHAIICDEAQALKNASAKAGEALRGLDARHRICLTGTPVENHLGELYSLVAWLAPGLLGAPRAFDRIFRRPIEKEGDRKRQELLRRRVAPIILRRTKQAVASELPEKTESLLTVELTAAQRALYESIRAAMDAEVRQAIADKGLKRSHIEVLAALLKLRQACCDPRLVKTPAARKAGAGAKLEALADLLPNLIEDGRRVLLFSQFTSMLDLIEADVVKPLEVPYLRLDGSTAKRQPLIDRFQAGEAPLFLLSLKAGGVGLTLTAADTVIHYDPWWNPAVEDQATDRAHRIGQDKKVLVYRLVCAGTVEERMLGLQGRKRAIAAGLHGDDGQSMGQLDEADIAALFAPLPDK